MKLIEKLSIEFIEGVRKNPNFSLIGPVMNYLFTRNLTPLASSVVAYQAGFRKAREMAADVANAQNAVDLRCMNDCRFIIGDAISTLGEEEVDGGK